MYTNRFLVTWTNDTIDGWLAAKWRSFGELHAAITPDMRSAITRDLNEARLQMLATATASDAARSESRKSVAMPHSLWRPPAEAVYSSLAAHLGMHNEVVPISALHLTTDSAFGRCLCTACLE